MGYFANKMKKDKHHFLRVRQEGKELCSFQAGPEFCKLVMGTKLSYLYRV